MGDMMKRYATVDDYVDDLDAFRGGVEKLRALLLGLGLEESIKWGAPAYSHNGRLLIGIAAFKNYFALWFHQGALLADEAGVLFNAQEGKTKALRQWRFEAARDVKVRAVKAYVREAMQLEEEGKRIAPERRRPVTVPPELRAALSKSAPARKAFEALTLGRRREYADYVAEAKRDDTKQKRVAKILPMIRAGKGLNDRYR